MLFPLLPLLVLILAILVAAMVLAYDASEPTCLADLLPPTSAATATIDAAVVPLLLSFC